MRIKKQETRLTLQEHDDDYDDEMKFLVPNYICLLTRGLPPPNPRSLCPQLNLLAPPLVQNSWVRHCFSQCVVQRCRQRLRHMNGEMILTKETRSTWRRACPQCHMSTISSTSNGLMFCLGPGLGGERPGPPEPLRGPAVTEKWISNLTWRGREPRVRKCGRVACRTTGLVQAVQ